MSDITLIHLLYTADPTSTPATSEAFSYLKGDENGALWMRPIAELSGGSVAIQTARNPDSDGFLPSSVTSFDTACFLFGWNGSNYDRLRSSGNNTNSRTPVTLGLLESVSYLYGYDADDDNWDRIRTFRTDQDSVSQSNNGALKCIAAIQGFNGSSFDRITIGSLTADNDSPASKGAVKTKAHGYHFNGSGFDRVRGNTQQTIFASAAYTATQTSGDLINYNARGIILSINVTAIVDTPSVVFSVQEKDPTSGLYSAILTTAAITATGFTKLHIYPGLDKVASSEQNHVLPRNYRIAATHADGDSMTYSVGEQLIV